MARLVEGRVAIVTGAGGGIGREHALSLARHGAKVVVNDLGGDRHGVGADASMAQQVVDEIVAAGGEAVANGDSVADWEGAQRLIRTAIDTFGDLHVLVNNAGILRDRVLANMTEEEWDAVINVHLKGTFAPSRWAVAHWREQAKAGQPVSGRIINTTSISGIYGNPGQSNYGAAKAGIAAFTNIVALEVGSLRRDGQRRRSGRPDADDRGPRPGAGDRRGARGPGPALDRADRHVARLRGVGRRDRSCLRSVGPGPRRSPKDGSAARRRTRSTIRRSSATWSPSCSPTPARTPGMDGRPGHVAAAASG